MAHARRRQPASADRLCLILELKGQARPKSLQVWSYAKNKTVSLPRSLIQIETPNATRFAAATVPRWLMNREGLWFRHPRSIPEFCRQSSADERSAQQRRDDAEFSAAEATCDLKNRYIRLPDQLSPIGGGDADGGRARRS